MILPRSKHAIFGRAYDDFRNGCPGISSYGCTQPGSAFIRSARRRKTWVSETGNLYLSENQRWMLYDLSDN